MSSVHCASLGLFYALTEASVYGGVSTPCIHCNGVCKSLIRTFAAGSGTPFFVPKMQKYLSKLCLI